MSNQSFVQKLLWDWQVLIFVTPIYLHNGERLFNKKQISKKGKSMFWINLDLILDPIHRMNTDKSSREGPAQSISAGAKNASPPTYQRKY